jgi:hypothetical protein
MGGVNLRMLTKSGRFTMLLGFRRVAFEGWPGLLEERSRVRSIGLKFKEASQR